jgi:hypothetical protein
MSLRKGAVWKPWFTAEKGHRSPEPSRRKVAPSKQLTQPSAFEELIPVTRKLSCFHNPSG